MHSAEGAPLGELFSFLSGLYFRGKRAYAEVFGRPPPALAGGLVISPAEGLRFLHERVTVERLRAWSEVAIDERNPRFTRPLLAHAEALQRTIGHATRFVLLGSVATDKYVEPLRQAFGDGLLFPPDFRGRGDMSRGALLLRAARSHTELSYAPIEGAERHGPRPAPLPRQRAEPVVAPEGAPELVIFVGLPGSGKTTFFRQRFAGSHEHISKDHFRRHRRPAARQAELLEQALSARRSLVVDNTNVGAAERAELIAAARRHGARVVGYFFEGTTRECLTRNRAREGKARIPDVGVLAAAKRLVRPSHEEGFDVLYVASVVPGERFEIRPEPRDPSALLPAAEQASEESAHAPVVRHRG